MMPKFVSGSSGHTYAQNRTGKNDDEDVSSMIKDASNLESVKKPSAINKKGTKEKQKNSLDLFKEELRRLHEQRDEQRNKIKKHLKDTNLSPEQETSLPKKPIKPQPTPVPLKPDPRCSTTLTLQVNLNPKDRESSMGGSYDNGDLSTTNIYLGNINPTVNENDLCDVFGKFGPLASIKIMWPRTEEEKARNRNSGFVAYMSRLDAERAIKALNGKEFKNYDMKLGWGKAVPIPLNPVYVPPELLKLTLPPPQSGLPFNGQLHESDLKRGYIVPNPYPRPLPVELELEACSNPNLHSIKETYEEFIDVLRRATVKVVPPTDRSVMDRIHKTIEYIIREGPVFEAIIIAREQKNSDYRFLYDNCSQEHIYYRWKLYSIMHGDDPYEWKTEEFRMFDNGSIWKPPPLNPYADGMPLDCVDSSTPFPKPVIKETTKKPFLEGSIDLNSNDNSRTKGTLGVQKREALGDLLRNLDPTKGKIGTSMMFCINHADAAEEIIDCIYESLILLETPFQKKIARLFLVSDILHNCSATVTNASYYRKGFQTRLTSIFEHSREYLINIEDRYKADKFKQKILSVLGAWKEWTLYEDEFVIKLSNILLGIKQEESQETKSQELTNDLELKNNENDLDGTELDDETLGICLEAKGLSLRWYKTLELSEDEEDQSHKSVDSRGNSRSPSSQTSCSKYDNTSDKLRFKTSKWETVDPNEVAGQVVTMSKWEAMAKAEDDSSSSGSRSVGYDDNIDSDEGKVDSLKASKRFKKDSGT